MIETINLVYNLIDGNNLLEKDTMTSKRIDYEKTIERLSRYKRMFFTSSISPDTMLRLMYNVRKIEYLDDKNKYPFDLKTFKRGFISRMVNSSFLSLGRHFTIKRKNYCYKK